MRAPLDLRLADAAAEQVRRSHAQAIAEMQGIPVLGLRVLTVEIPNASEIRLAHRLGRRPQMVLVSVPRGAISVGIVRDTTAAPTTGSAPDPTSLLCLRADGFGATITVDVAVF